MSRKKKEVYESDLSDAQWGLVAPVLHQAVGRVGRISRREILNAIFYVHRTGCQWRFLPVALPASQLPSLENGVLLFLALAKEWSVGRGIGISASGSAVCPGQERSSHSGQCGLAECQEHGKRGLVDTMAPRNCVGASA